MHEGGARSSSGSSGLGIPMPESRRTSVSAPASRPPPGCSVLPAPRPSRGSPRLPPPPTAFPSVPPLGTRADPPARPARSASGSAALLHAPRRQVQEMRSGYVSPRPRTSGRPDSILARKEIRLLAHRVNLGAPRTRSRRLYFARGSRDESSCTLAFTLAAPLLGQPSLGLGFPVTARGRMPPSFITSNF